MDRDRREQLAVEVDPEVKQLLKEQDGFMWENLQRAIFQTYGGSLDTPEAVRSELEQVRRDRRNLVEQRDRLNQKIKQKKNRIENLEDRLEQLESQKSEKIESLDRLLGFAEQSRLWPSHGKVEAVAEDHFGGDGRAVLEALLERADEKNIHIPEENIDLEGDSR